MEKYLIVIPYISSGAQGNELELAITGWRKHFKEDYKIVIVGDYHPIVDTGDDITLLKCDRIPETNDGNYRPAMDVMNKLQLVRNTYSNTKGFILAYDDIYAVNDFDINDIKFLKALEPDIVFTETSSNGWRRAKAKTKKILLKEGYPTRNFSIHLPRWYEWDKLEELWNKYDMFHHDYVTEDLYFNIYYKDRVPFMLNKETDNIKFGIYKSGVTKEQIKQAFKNKIWINNSTVGWSADLEKLLKEHYKI